MLDYYYENIRHAINYSHIKKKNLQNVDFHLHNWFELYFFISGDVNYFIEKQVYDLQYGDLLVMNNHEIHKPSFKSRKVYERLVIHFDPVLLRIFSSPQYNLFKCFTDRPIGQQNKINMNKNQINEVKNMLLNLERLNESTVKGSEILLLTGFIEIIVYINSIFENLQLIDNQSNIPEKLAPILDYIDENLESDLSLETLEQRFYIDRFYLSRLFKKCIGSNLHEYIIFKRISKAKILLSDGYNVTDTASFCGFNDYSNFLRMFKRTVGISPGQYKKQVKHSLY